METIKFFSNHLVELLILICIIGNAIISVYYGYTIIKSNYSKKVYLLMYWFVYSLILMLFILYKF